MDFQRVARLSEIPDPGRIVVEVDDQLVVVLHVGGKVFAIDDVCTHDGGPLGEGELKNHTIACPHHGATFDIRTGAALAMPATRPTRVHDVNVEGDEVFVRIRE
jgi:3-phenylpropionate/trans-cinnamate dioxygenase ferredoxin component